MNAAPPWRSVLAHAARGDHVVQFYQDEDFLAEALSHFVGEGLRAGEGVMVLARARHWNACAECLPELRNGPGQARDSGQLQVLDADEALNEVASGDFGGFRERMGNAVARAQHRHGAVRVFGELVDMLWSAERHGTALQLERLWHGLCAEHALSLLCAYRLDPFDTEPPWAALESLCGVHSHFIPVPHYERLDEAVREACMEVLPRPLVGMMESLVERYRPAARMPQGAATLLWLHGNMPVTAGKVLTLARERYRRSLPP